MSNDNNPVKKIPIGDGVFVQVCSDYVCLSSTGGEVYLKGTSQRALFAILEGALAYPREQGQPSGAELAVNLLKTVSSETAVKLVETAGENLPISAKEMRDALNKVEQLLADEERRVSKWRGRSSSPDSTSFLERLVELAELQDGWLDGAGKAIPHQIVATLAQKFPLIIEELTMPLPWVYPVEEGGIRLEWYLDGRDTEVEFLSTGDIEVFASAAWNHQWPILSWKDDEWDVKLTEVLKQLQNGPAEQRCVNIRENYIPLSTYQAIEKAFLGDDVGALAKALEPCLDYSPEPLAGSPGVWALGLAELRHHEEVWQMWNNEIHRDWVEVTSIYQMIEVLEDSEVWK